MSLSSKQQAFAEAYCANGFNATKAALSAGYSEKTSYAQGHHLLKNVEIQEHIQKFKDKATERALVTIEDVVRGLLREAKYDDDGNTHSARVAAWKALSDYTGGFDANKQKVEHSGEVAQLSDQQIDQKLEALLAGLKSSTKD